MFNEISPAPGVSGAAARRARGRIEMQGAILEAARSIVDEKGVDKLTLRSIAQTLGYSAGAIYEYFDSKEEILKALYFLGTDGLGDRMAKTVSNLPPEISSVDAIIAIAQTYRAYAHDNVDLYWLAFSGMKQRPEPVAVAVDTHDPHAVGFGPLLKLINAGIADGTFVDDLDPLAIAIAAWSAVHGFVSLELGGHMNDEMLVGAESCLAERQIQIRDDLFTTLTRTVLYGFVRRN